ncbi:hypothetical protein [Streptomyces sp. N50]|uniref:hypothetical protein n=1 Tax=Streptomyces sp. N50 TaxID=3081765 RepID=UPI0029625235|nr:hypothetical protein [Streptomyces sp. N50]WOX10663.1 hypothetical protein R2B38_18250 [Streptomyces sp. N50]
MSNQPYEGPYEGYGEGYDPYAQQQQQPHAQQQQPQQAQAQAQAQAWPGHQQAYDDPQAAQQYTQQWQGQTWDTQVQQSRPSASDLAYFPPQNYQAPQPSYDPHAQAPVAAPPAPATPDEAAGYGPPSLAGNARITDAQRARLEGRSPIIEPGMQPAGLTAVLALLLSVTAQVGSYALVVPLVILQAVTAAGWFRLNGMWPARQGIALAFAGALVADVALLAAGRENGPAAILGTLGVWVLLSLVMQLRSHADPDTRITGLMATVASAALAIVATGHLAADPDAVTVGAAAVAVAILARALPLPTVASVVVSLLAAAGAGIAVGGMTGMGAKGALLGAGAAVCALIGHRVASYDYPSRFVHFTAGVALPLTAAAPAVYLLGRALV